MQGWHAKKYASKVGMMYECKGISKAPSFSHYNQTVHGSLLKCTNLYTGSSWPQHCSHATSSSNMAWERGQYVQSSSMPCRQLSGMYLSSISTRQLTVVYSKRLHVIQNLLNNCSELEQTASSMLAIKILGSYIIMKATW